MGSAAVNEAAEVQKGHFDPYQLDPSHISGTAHTGGRDPEEGGSWDYSVGFCRRFRRIDRHDDTRRRGGLYRDVAHPFLLPD